MFLTVYEIVLVLVLHFISDFLLQTRKIAQKKSSDYLALFLHCIIVFVVFWPFFGIKFAALNAFIHAVIDRNVWNIYKYIRRNENEKTFQFWNDSLFYSFIGFDQFLHVLTLILLLDNAI